MPVTPDQIADAIKRALKVIDDLISKLNDLQDAMKSFETKKNVAKTIGTTINAVGAGLAIGTAFFTGGLTLLGASVISTVVGTGTNLVTDFVDRKETKDCMNRINGYLGEFDSQIKKIQELIEQFNSQIEDSMKDYGIDQETAISVAFGVHPKVRFNAIAVAALMTGSKLLTTSLTAMKLTPEAKLLFDLLGMTAQTTSKTGAAIGSSGYKVLGEMIGKKAAVVGIVLTAYEVIHLVKTLTKDHPSLEGIKKAKNDLRKQKASLQQNVKDISGLQKTAKKLIENALVELMQELLGGGYQKKRNNILEPQTFEEYVDAIGTGGEGGMFHLIFTAEMLGRPIEIHDRTEERQFARLYGKTDAKIFPFVQISTEPIRLVITSSNGVNHFNVLSSSGKLIDITKGSVYSNRCLFDALACLLGTSTDGFIKRLQQYLRLNPMAKEVYDINISEMFPEFRGGAKRVNGDPSKQVKITSSNRVRNGQYEEETVTAVVRQENLNQGSNVTDAVRRAIREIGLANDDAGHLIAFILGGYGNSVTNVVPMSVRLNRGQWRMMEICIFNVLTFRPNWTARVTITLQFDPNSDKPNRPRELRFIVTFYDQNGVPQAFNVTTFEDPTGKTRSFPASDNFDQTFDN